MRTKHPLYRKMLGLQISLQTIADVVGCSKTGVYNQLTGFSPLRDSVQKAIKESIMEKRHLPGTDPDPMSDGTFDMSPLETKQFKKLVYQARPGWYVVAIRPSGVNMEEASSLSDACDRQKNTCGPAYLFKAPEDSFALKVLLDIRDELTFSFDVEDGEIREGNFHVDGEVHAILRPGDKWRKE